MIAVAFVVLLVLLAGLAGVATGQYHELKDLRGYVARTQAYLTSTVTRYAADMDRWLVREDEWRRKELLLDGRIAQLRSIVQGEYGGDTPTDAELDQMRAEEYGRQVKGGT